MKLTHRVVEVDDQVVLGQIEAVLSQVLRPMEVTVRICPDDRQVLEEAMPPICWHSSLRSSVCIWLTTPRLAVEGCVLSYGQGQDRRNDSDTVAPFGGIGFT